MRRFLKSLLALVSILALFLGGSEAFDGSCDLLWTFGCLAVSALTGFLAATNNPAIDWEERV